MKMSENENTYKFQKLTPVDNVDIKIYEDAIDYIFDNPDIRNVAVSGAYSAGKSSVLASYKKKHDNLRFTHISLAHFEVPEQKDKIKDNESPEQENESGKRESSQEKESVEANKTIKVKESVLEGKILNQLIHQIPSNKIPQTNFKVKQKVDSKRVVRSVLLAVLFVLTVLHITFFDSWNSYLSLLPNNWFQSFLSLSTSKYSLLVSGMFCVIIFYIFLYSLVKAQKNKNVFRKISLQGNEIEIFEENDESYFDKYLNEVLYLFENSDADVIVFEDMDRFKTSNIFERLHEVNTLANIQLQKENESLTHFTNLINKIIKQLQKTKLFSNMKIKKKNKYPLRFFYLLRDDIFVSKDRTKFFDYIVPVVPVVDSSNSYDQFILHFKEGGIFELFDETFLQGLSLYVDDMRILKNIYNEFVVYYNRLNTTKLDCNKMLAMIAYKNLFPRDFSDSQLNQGMVSTLFDKKKKDEFIKEEIERLEEQAVQKKSEIEFARKEQITSVQELDDVYNAKQSRTPQNYGQHRTQYINELKHWHDTEYPRRKKAIEDRLNNRLPMLEDELSRLEHEIVATQSKQLKDIITRENINSIFKVTTKNEIGIETSFYEIKGSEYFALLKYLIWNGYIDETYADYMTYFYENSLSRVDKIFLRSITDRKAEKYTYSLKNLNLVVDRLRLVDFDQEEILNFDLFQYLLQTPKYQGYLNRFLCQLKDTKDFKFTGAYFDTDMELPAYVKNLNLQWPEMFYYAVKENTLTEKQIRPYSLYTLYYSDDNSLQAVNTNDCLTQYISKSSDYLDIITPDIDKLIHGFNLLEVFFEGIDYDHADKELFDAVYQNSLYEINFSNLTLMLQKVYKVENEDDIRHKNYTLILTQPESALVQYVKQNIRIYLDVILSNSNGMINDNENVALLILNDDETISIEQKTLYIESLLTTITSIAEVKDASLWGTLLNNRLVLYSGENVIEYFGNSKLLDSTIVEFINNGESTLNFSDSKNVYGDEKIEKLFDASIVCNELSNLKYKEIVTSLGFWYDTFDVAGISVEKLRILIDEKIVRMNVETLTFMRDNYSSQILYFIEKSINEYADIITIETFDLNELVAILSWECADDIKIKLLSLTKEPLTILEKGYSSTVNEYILTNNLDANDLPSLFVSYEKWDSILQKIICSLAIKNIDRILANIKKVSVELLRAIIGLDDLNSNKKIDILLSLMPNLDKNTCKEFLSLLGLSDHLKLFEPRSRPKFKVDTTNEKLLTAFKENNWIHDFQEDQERTGFYKIIRQKPTTKPLPSELL